jgi:hypothetical protein
MAYQHTCLSQGTWLCLRSAPGKPSTKRCQRCGGHWQVTQGRYAVLPWRGDGRYDADQALGIYNSRPVAERHITDPGQQCIRFLVDA